jgi:GntR family transcriptional regulator
MLSSPFTQERPIFAQIAERIEDAILSGVFPEEGQVPSTTEVSVRFKINPATALKGVSLLVDQGTLYKKRGLGMFVASGAVRRLQEQRRAKFYEGFVRPLNEEAKRLNIPPQELKTMIERSFEE